MGEEDDVECLGDLCAGQVPLHEFAERYGTLSPGLLTRKGAPSVMSNGGTGQSAHRTKALLGPPDGNC
ncbi:hypothetical protein [Kitasatospora purpeofusca]|uniref:hypothetical protein n=1 Tax=Kitasatospora purpeofusca TaxID=67352 RepID=UPI00364BE05D